MTDIALRESTELAHTDPTGGRLVAWAEAASAAHQLANALSLTTFVPAHFRGKVDDATAAILMGDELGLSPLAAFRSIYVVHGTPALYARGMVALAQSKGHEVWTVKSTETEVVVSGKRRGSSQVETAKWTIQRASKAGYTNNKKYQTNPEEMLYSKAAAEVCRKIAADVLAGVPYSVEELELDDAPSTTTVTRSSGTTKVSRKNPAAEPEPQPPADEPTSTDEALSDDQRRKIMALANDLGLDRDQRLAGCSAVTGREIGSTNDLTKAEASQVIERMQARLDAANEVIEGELVDADSPDTLPTDGSVS